MSGITIREAEKEEIHDVSRVLAPAFHDKVMLVVGDEEKALKIIPELIRTIVGETFVAVKDGGTGKDGKGANDSEDNETNVNECSEEIVGAIIISIKELKIGFGVVRACFRQLGLVASFRAFRKVFDYLRSVPGKGEGEGTLEAVGVLDVWRGQGIGERLVSTGEKYLRDNGKKNYGLGVKEGNGAVMLYEKLGFQTITSFENNLGTWLYMRKDLM